jgi:hypothetical protein
MAAIRQHLPHSFLRANYHAVAHGFQATLAIRSSVNLNETLEANAHHAIGCTWTSGYWRTTETPNTRGKERCGEITPGRRVKLHIVEGNAHRRIPGGRQLLE